MQINGSSREAFGAEFQPDETSNDFDILPDEVKQRIFSEVNKDVKTLFNMSATSTSWRNLNLDPVVINQLFADTLPQAVVTYKESGNERDLLYAIATDARMASKTSKPEQKKVEKPIDETDSNTCANLSHASICYQGQLITGSLRGELIRFFDSKTGELLKKLTLQDLLKDSEKKTQPNQFIFILKIIDDKLFIGLDEGELIVWDLKTDQKNVLSFEEKSPLWQIEAYKDKLILSFMNEGIRVINLNNLNEKMVQFDERSSAKFCLSGDLVITSHIYSIRLWNMEGELLSEFKANFDTHPVANKGKLICGKDEGLIQIWDIDTKNELMTIKAHDSKITGLKVVNNKIISSSEDKKIRIWNLEGNLLKEFETAEVVHSLDFNEGRIYGWDKNDQLTIIDFNPKNSSSNQIQE